MDFAPQQDRALQAVSDWLQRPVSESQVFRLFGYAGTGKTTLARHLAEGVSGNVYFAAFTGKAAYVLRTKGCPNAMTIHKLIYLPRFKSVALLKQLEEQLAQMPADHPDRARLEVRVKEEHNNLSRPAFTLNLDSVLQDAALLVVDEVSMVDQEMGADLLSFGCKILVLGDPAQLPPVRGTGYFTEQTPDFLLTDIHRQARDNPIIRLASLIREQKMPDLGTYGESTVRGRMTPEDALQADQLIVGKNDTRQKFNARVRQLLGRASTDPVPGDKLVCLRNSRDFNCLLNGSLSTVRVCTQVTDDRLTLELDSELGDVVQCMAHRAYFQGGTPPWYERSEAEEFDYGNALTAHKAQGSQWSRVLVYDESHVFKADRWRWLYTAMTRAAGRVDLIRTQ